MIINRPQLWALGNVQILRRAITYFYFQYFTQGLTPMITGPEASLKLFDRKSKFSILFENVWKLKSNHHVCCCFKKIVYCFSSILHPVIDAKHILILYVCRELSKEFQNGSF